MLKNKALFVAVLLLCLVTFVGCDDEDGKWDSIQITVNGDKCKSSTYKVPAEGGVFRINSKNYGCLWLNAVKENGKTIWPLLHDSTHFWYIHLTADWYEVQYDNEKNLVANIHPKADESSSRSLAFAVECGDAFGSITLLQE